MFQHITPYLLLLTSKIIAVTVTLSILYNFFIYRVIQKIEKDIARVKNRKKNKQKS